MGGGSAPIPKLNPEPAARLKDVRLAVTRVHSLNGLGAAGEDMLEQSPVRSATEEVLAHGDESGEKGDGVGREIVQLGTEEDQKSSEERVRWS